jgi:hypothetical protein
MNQPTRSSVVLLALAGLGSALFTVATTFKGDVAEFSVGLVLGVSLAIYFVVYEGYRTPGKILTFICACTAAFPAAQFSAVGLLFVFPGDASGGSAKFDIPVPVFFGAGWIGAFLVLAAGTFLFGPRNINWKSLRMVLPWSIAGGLLGVAGGGADGIRTHGTYHEMLLLFLIWQPGVAILLGLLLSRERRSLAVPSTPFPIAQGVPKVRAKPGIAVVAGVFFTCLLGFLGFLVVRTVQSERIASDRAAAHKRSIAEAPSVLDLPRIEPLLPEQALIVHEIAGLYPWLPMSNSLGPSGSVPAINYAVGYTVTKDQHGGSILRVVAVNVTQLPTAEWARYRVRYPPANVAIQSSEYLSNVKKFGQTVVQDTSRRYPDGGGTLCFLWPSGNFAVSLCYETRQVDDEFLKQYLEKYPSSL